MWSRRDMISLRCTTESLGDVYSALAKDCKGILAPGSRSRPGSSWPGGGVLGRQAANNRALVRLRDILGIVRFAAAGEDRHVFTTPRLGAKWTASAIPQLVERIKQAGTWNCVTLVVTQKGYSLTQEEVKKELERPYMKYLPPHANPAMETHGSIGSQFVC